MLALFPRLCLVSCNACSDQAHIVYNIEISLLCSVQGIHLSNNIDSVIIVSQKSVMMIQLS